MNCNKKFLLLWVIFAHLDPDPRTRLNPDSNRIRIRNPELRKATEMLAEHCLFGRPLPIQSAVACRKVNRCYKRCGSIKRKENFSPRIIPNICHPPTPLISHRSLALKVLSNENYGGSKFISIKP
jgi:hypothetical protein